MGGDGNGSGEGGGGGGEDGCGKLDKLMNITKIERKKKEWEENE